MPTPLMVRTMEKEESVWKVSVNALAPALNTMPLTSMSQLDPTSTAVTLETSKVAVSAGPLGTVAGVQLVAVFQSPLVGLRFHVALPAKAVLAAESRNGTKTTANTNTRAPRRRGEGIICLISLRRNELQKLCLILIFI